MRIKEENNTNKSFKYCVIGVAMGVLTVTCIEPALATFDMDKGVKAATDPLVALITKYYGIGVGLGAIGGAFTAQGDWRTKGISAGIGAGVAGGVILGILKAVT